VLTEIIKFVKDDGRLYKLISSNLICHNEMNSTNQIKKTPVLENSSKVVGFNIKTTNNNNIELVSQATCILSP